MKLLLAIPSLDYMIADFVESLLALVERLNADGIEHEIKIVKGSLVHMARGKLAKYAIDKGFTDVLWLDSDMIFQPSLVEDLSFCGKSFVTGIAHSRRAPFGSCLFKKTEGAVERFTLKEYPKEPFKVAACGFACVLMKTEILKRTFAINGNAFTPTANTGEDVAFCKRARAAGFEIWAEPMVRLGHVGHIAIYPEDSERWNEVYSDD